MDNNEQQRLARAWCNTDQGRDFMLQQRGNYGMHNWTPLSAPVDPTENTRVATAMSQLTKNGKVPTYEEAREYAYAEMLDGREPDMEDL